jgi:hypothetical protein
MNAENMQIYINAAAIASGVIFWAAFLVFGMIARRYHVVFNKNTFHVLLMSAPSGILAYSVLMALKSSALIKTAALNSMVQTTAYGLLFISCLLCLLSIIKFGMLINELQKYKG